ISPPLRNFCRDDNSRSRSWFFRTESLTLLIPPCVGRPKEPHELSRCLLSRMGIMQQEHPRRSRPRVLVVEDDFLTALALEGMLIDAGCAVVGPVPRVSEALEVIEVERLDLALLDVNLAGERVFPVADVLVERGVPFVFTTGYSAEHLPPRHRNRPILAKPYSPVQHLDLLHAPQQQRPAGRTR